MSDLHLSERATIERIRSIEAELMTLRAEAYHRSGLPLPGRHERAEAVIALAGRLSGVERAQIVGASRDGPTCRARFAAMFVLQRAYGLSTTTIGRCFGNRDHSTVINGLRRAQQWRDQDDVYRALTDALLQTFVPKESHDASN